MALHIETGKLWPGNTDYAPEERRRMQFPAEHIQGFLRVLIIGGQSRICAGASEMQGSGLECPGLGLRVLGRQSRQNSALQFCSFQLI